MTKSTLALVAGAGLVLFIAAGGQKSAEVPIAIHTRADAVHAMDQIQSDLAALDQHQQKYRAAAEKLGELYSGLSKKVEAVSKAAGGLKPRGSGSGAMVGSSSSSDAVNQLLAATQQMQETQMSFNLQYLQLQESMQNESREYTAVSNIMKTKHDTVKNSISNMR
jgi:predicted  nucleic acid-binding Zn-ribbon protein